MDKSKRVVCFIQGKRNRVDSQSITSHLKREERGGGGNFLDHIKKEMLGRRWATSIIRGSGRSWEDLGTPCPRSSPTLSEKKLATTTPF